jgi:hypothetical protein
VAIGPRGVKCRREDSNRVRTSADWLESPTEFPVRSRSPECRREDSNLERTCASGPEPPPVDHLGTATQKAENRVPVE